MLLLMFESPLMFIKLYDGHIDANLNFFLLFSNVDFLSQPLD